MPLIDSSGTTQAAHAILFTVRCKLIEGFKLTPNGKPS